MPFPMALPPLRTITALHDLFHEHFPLPDDPCFSPVGIRQIIRDVRACGHLGRAVKGATHELVSECPTELQEMIGTTLSLTADVDVPVAELSVAVVYTYLVAIAEWRRVGTITPESIYAIVERLDLLITLCAVHTLSGDPNIGLTMTNDTLEVTIPHRRR